MISRTIWIISLVSLFSTILYGQSTADFSAEITSGCPPFALKLLDNSSNPNGITAWEWTINGNPLSVQQNPASLINEPGDYEICLTITTAQGTDQECKTDYITVFENPTANLTSNAQEGCLPFDVEFTNSSIAGSGNISNIIWDFGGSCGVVNTSPDEVVSCIYENAGSFQVSMIVSDDNGCQDNIVLSDYIQTNPLPIINVVVPAFDNCEPPFIIDFGAAGPDNPAIAYTWDFGNGNSFQGNDPPVVTFADSGPYTIVVDAINTETNCSQNVVLTDAIQEANPIDFSFERGNDCGTAILNFNDLTNGSPDLIEWDFGDGNQAQVASPIHEYAAFGCYTVTLTRTVGNCIKSISREVCISEITEPVVNASISNLMGCSLPHTAVFNVNPMPGFTYNWDFGDGQTSTLQSPSHSYDAHGDYNVTLTVTGQLGCEVIIPVDLVQVQPIGVSLGSTVQQGCAPLNVEFNPQISSFVPITSYDWSIVDQSGVTIFQSSEANPSYSFTELGCYDVLVNLANTDGCQTSLTISNIYCVGEAPTPSFSVDPMEGCASQTFSFTDLSTGDIDYWQWDFESDGVPDLFTQNPTFQYDDLGCFDVELLVSSFGCEAITSLGPICVEAPIASFEFSIDCDIPTSVSFVNLSEEADSMWWDFGVLDLSTDTSTMLSPVYDFPALGDYEVELITYNYTTDCTDTARLEVSLSIPEAIFEIGNLEHCRGELIVPVNNSIGATSYLWTLPDGGEISNATIENPTITFPEAGTFSIVLEILNDNNCSSVYAITNIQISGPEPDFDFSVSGNCVPFIVNFNDLSSNLFSQNNSWEWNIEELNLSSTSQFPEFELDTVGIFTVSLVIEDSRGCLDSIERSIGLNEGSPVAYFTGDLFGCEEVINSFENNSVGNGLGITWDFGDGESSNEENPSHEFPLGDFNVCLTIDDNNCIDTHCELVQIQEIIAEFEVDENFSSCAPSPVDFFNLSQNSSSFFWNYGDGTGDIEVEQGSHIYNLQGIYDVQLIAIGENIGCRDTMMLSDAVVMTGPLAEFNYTIDDFCVPSELEIKIEGAKAYDYLVFFGDGNSYELNNKVNVDTVYTFTNPSADGLVPTVLVQESAGCELPLIGEDTLRFSELNIEFSTDDAVVCFDDQEVFFESNIISSELEFLTEWNFESGIPASSSDSSESVLFENPGAYDVQLIVSNANCKDSLRAEDYIQVFPEAHLSLENIEACLGDTVQISANGNTEYYNWSPNENLLTADSSSISFIATESLNIEVVGGIGLCPEIAASSEIEVFQLPTLEMENFYVYFPGEELTIGPQAVDTLNYYWEASDLLSCSFCPNPSIQNDSIGDFRLQVTDPLTGCHVEDVVQVRQYSQCPENSLLVPNAFSPNGDGKNDEFKVYAGLLEEVNYVRIFDRWGNFLWETDNIEAGWNGTFKGKKMGSGVYVYTIESTCSIDGRPYKLQGDLTLLR